MTGDVYAIGGHEDTTGKRALLAEFVKSMPRSKVVVLTAATSEPEASFEKYDEAFSQLGVQTVVQLDVRSREASNDSAAWTMMDDAGGFFFTGGDQLRVVDTLGTSGLSEALRQAWEDGAAMGGTSAGAAVMSRSMLVRGRSGESNGTDEVTLAPGLGYLDRVIIDQHFAERGRVGRLLAAVALKPELMGLGIDENTAVCVRGDQLIALGAGAVTVLDAVSATCNSSRPDSPDPLSIFDVRLHQLAAGNYLDISSREPSKAEPT